MKNIFDLLIKTKSILYISILLISILSCSKPPLGNKGIEADKLTNKIILATQQQFWNKSKVLEWTFNNSNKHIWDRNRNLIKVSWDDIVVYESLDSKRGKVFEKGIELDGEKKIKYLEKAYNYWGNDSYWLNPFFKFFENGVERRVVKQENGSDALLITHSSGGSTPGDSYLWLLDENGLPNAWKLWVSIIPIKGFKISWEDWITLSTGLKISTAHKSKLIDIELTNVKATNSLIEAFPDKDPFEIILKGGIVNN